LGRKALSSGTNGFIRKWVEIDGTREGSHG
jgi:hypothetical protein